MSCLILVEQRGQNHLPMSSRPIDIHITEVAPAPTVGPSIIEVPGFNSPRACLEKLTSLALNNPSKKDMKRLVHRVGLRHRQVFHDGYSWFTKVSLLQYLLLFILGYRTILSAIEESCRWDLRLAKSFIQQQIDAIQELAAKQGRPERNKEETDFEKVLLKELDSVGRSKIE
ncbi:hypothetical protein AA0113_g9543 [Alternaria arborescens]|uniref:Uncharacterized protein n=1 Tax=Alternaria arborescens TaxID=156630 RepID=A0A4Q4RA44_9PLEO|nr:hypothetical protein AA0113_g9543 [Alternaria arborescens]